MKLIDTNNRQNLIIFVIHQPTVVALFYCRCWERGNDEKLSIG